MSKNLTNEFHLGCNYWASNAGCFMWQEWDEATVRNDLALLAQHDITTLRVFPLWSDFQPLKMHYAEFGNPKQMRRGDDTPQDDPLSHAGIDLVMIQRFETFCQIAHEHDLKLTVMLLTGWMSGRQFKPEPFHDRNIYTDPLVLRWSARFCDTFVRHFRAQPAIIAWGFGNESNIMSPCPSSHAAYAWSALMARTIRAADPTRPLISGMHGLTVADPDRPWRIDDQGELCDVVTTHPYTIFVAHCDLDPLTSIRGTLHGTAESCLYSDIAGRPCMAEEIGDLGRCVADTAHAQQYLRTLLYANWSHGNLGCLWWCAFDQDHIDRTPYQWYPMERELGLFDLDKQPKPVVTAYRNFRKTLDALPDNLRVLPPRRTEAVCILTNGQDQWAAALASFILAKQAGFDLRFTTHDAPIPAADLYLVPSMCGLSPIHRDPWRELLRRVEQDGATLYFSIYDALLPDLADYAGLRVQLRQPWQESPTAVFTDDGVSVSFPAENRFSASRREGGTTDVSRPFRFLLEPTGADILATDQDNRPLFTRHTHGSGSIHLLNFPVETVLTINPGAFEPTAPDYARFYRTIAADLIPQRLLQKPSDQRALTLTEHPFDENTAVCVAINHSPDPITTGLAVNPQVKSVSSLTGTVAHDNAKLTITVAPFDAVVLQVTV